MKTALLGLLLLSGAPGGQDGLRTPESYFGHRVGEDRKLFTYPRCVEYLRELEKASDRIRLVELGKSTLGNPIVMAVIGDDLKEVDRVREIARELAGGRVPEERARELARQGKVIVMVTCNIHSTEIASSQAAAEIAWRAVRASPPGVIFLLLPSTNPDGQIMVTEWYRKHLGTEFEGGPMPWLYHPYCGHDNNRDWFMFNLAETRAVSEAYYRTWFPQVIVDHHQMGSSTARMFVPPYVDPPNPSVHGLIHRWVNVIGTKMALDLEAAGKKGITHQEVFTAWWPGSSKATPWWHNQIGILTESASCRIATPVVIDRGEVARDEKVFFPSPWPGGKWGVRDIVENQIISTDSVLETASKHREEILFQTWQMARDHIGRASSGPAAYRVRSAKDRRAFRKLVDALLQANIEIHEDPAGCLIPLDQPRAAYVRVLFETQRYPGKDRPYDAAGWTLPMQMGLDVETVAKAQPGPRLTSVPTLDPGVRIREGEPAFVTVRDDTLDTHVLVNRLVKAGVSAYRALEPVGEARTGDLVVVTKQNEAALNRALEGLTTLPVPRPRQGRGRVLEARPVRLGLYKPWLASMDEGWTRLVLETFEFPYESIDNKRMKEGNLRESFDAIIVPDIPPAVITKGRTDEKGAEFFPPEYRGGIGDEGASALKAFVEAGGTVLAFDSSCDFALDTWPCPVKNVLKDDKEFACPGSVLRAEIDTAHPIGHGMPANAFLYFYDSPAFSTSLPPVTFDRKVVARYPEKESPLASGWIKAPEKIQGRAALVEVTLGKGRIVLFGFRVQHRAQTYGTFRMLFNAIRLATAREVELK